MQKLYLDTFEHQPFKSLKLVVVSHKDYHKQHFRLKYFYFVICDYNSTTMSWIIRFIKNWIIG